MTWKGVKVEDIRLQFIEAVNLNTECFGEICELYGIRRKTGYKWIKRYNLEGKKGLVDKRRSPISRPRDTEEEIINAIISTKFCHPSWGATKLRVALQREYPKVNWPSVTTFGNILKRKGLVSKRRIRSRYAQTSPIKDCGDTNDVWSIDFKGWWRTKSGEICEPLTVCDCFSRYLICCRHAKKKDTEFVWNALREAFEEYGMPRRIRSDNGPPFASNSVGRLSRLSIKLIRLGITPEWITPGKPQENGIIERIHRTLKDDLSSTGTKTLEDDVFNLGQFSYIYNWVRPHESINMLTPSDIFKPSTRIWTGEEKDPVYPEDYHIRKVETNGVIKWRGAKFFISELLRYESVGLKENANKSVEIYFGPILLAIIDPMLGYKKV